MRQAAEIESFFSNVSRAHHEQEERGVFPPLLAIGGAIAACKAANKKLAIGYRLRYEPTTMRAIEITKPGGPEVLRLCQRPMPEPIDVVPPDPGNPWASGR